MYPPHVNHWIADAEVTSSSGGSFEKRCPIDDRVIARTAVFIRPGMAPHADGRFAGLRCAVDEAGFVTVDATGRTSTPGVWAAGNAADPRAQVITAAGAGSAAAIAINADLVQDDVERAAEDHPAAAGAASR